VSGSFSGGDDGSMGTVGGDGVGRGFGDGWGKVSSIFPGVSGGIVTPDGGVDCANATRGVILT
jgi:hypothetical protein